MNTFRDKYFQLPGDMNNATSFWGATTCPGTAGVGTQTCNGNGDGVIDNPAAASQYGEVFTFWQHLANAGLIEGTYTGIASSASSLDSVLSVNSPKSKLGNAGWSVIALPNYAGNTYEFAFDYGNHFRFGTKNGTALFYNSALKPEEAWNIDTKLDDGKPGTGRVIAYNWDNCTDAASNGNPTVLDRTGAQYLLSQNSVLCALSFTKAF